MTEIGLAANDLSPLETTALVPFWSRVDDWDAPVPILRDSKAREIAAAVAQAYGRLSVAPPTRAGCCLRSKIIDDWLASTAAAGNRLRVVELGIGMNTRRDRLRLDDAHWFEVDLEGVIRAREDFLGPAGDVSRIGASIMALERWLPLVGKNGAGSRVVVILEGVLQYFETADVLLLFRRIGEAFPHAIVMFDSMSPVVQWVGNRGRREVADRPPYRWGITSTRALGRRLPRFTVLAERGFAECDARLLTEFSRAQRLLYGMPGLRRLHRLTMARL